MTKVDGIQNEYDIIKKLDNNKVSELSGFWQSFIKSTFHISNLNETIHASKERINMKQDISISVGATTKTVSIKSGYGVSVHEESINRFVGFLKWLGISDDSISFLKLYHFGDGTLNGTGKYKLSSRELNRKYKNEIIKFNDEVNEPKTLLKILHRFLMLGTPNQRSNVNILYYGINSGGIYCDMYKICLYYAYHKYEIKDRIHFGPLTYAPAFRGLNYNSCQTEEEKAKINNEKRRYYINIKWPNIKEDIITYNEFNNQLKENKK